MSAILCLMIGLAAYPDGPAKNGVQTTGAPLSAADKEYTCASCHTATTNYGVTATIKVYEVGTSTSVAQYTPGTSYDVTMTANTTSTPVGFGFQMTAIQSSTFAAAGTFSTPMANTQLRSQGGRSYYEHARRLGNTVKTYTIKWIAPTTGTGEVGFYGNVLAVNGNGGTNGDMTAQATLVLPEKAITAIEKETPKDMFSLEVFPNPAFGRVQVLSIRPVSLRVYDLNGREMATFRQTQLAEINTQNWPSGVYLIRADDGKYVSVKSFVKQ